MRNRKVGAALPRIVITGYGADVAGGGEWRARAAYAVFMGHLKQVLDILQVLSEGEERLAAEDFPFYVQWAPGEPSDEMVALSGVPREVLGRQATVGFALSPDAAAAERLEALHKRDRALRGDPFDVDVVARRVLHLPEGAPVDQSVRARLLGLVVEAEAAGRAGSLAALRAFHLERLGATGPAQSGYFTVDGHRVPGINWLGPDVMGDMDGLELDTDWSDVLTPQADGSLALGGGPGRQTPWPKGTRPYVVGADWRDGKVVVRLPDGSTVDVDVEEFIELVAADIARAGLPSGTPIVLAIPFLGRHSALLQKLADRTGLVVRAHSGEVKVSPRPDEKGDIGKVGIDTVTGRPGVPTGDWVPLRPGQGPVLDDSVPDWFHEVVMWPVVSEAIEEQVGYASFEPGEYAKDFEEPSRHADRITTFTHYHSALNAHALEQELPRPGPEGSPFPESDAYRITLHGLPGYVILTLWDGNDVVERFLGEGDAVAWVTWLVSRLPKDRWLDISCCWIGSPKDSNSRGPALRGTFAPEVFVADPLRQVSLAQRIMNATRRWARVSYGPQGLGKVDGKYVRSLFVDPQGRLREFAPGRPEPEGAELDRLAVVAGLHSGVGAVPAAVRERTLIALRALKLMFGVHVEDRADFGDLLRGVAAVDSMWLADPDFRRAGPLMLDLLRQVIAARPEAASGVDQDVARRVLAAAATAWETRPRGPQGKRVELPLREFVDLPVVREAAEWLDGDEAKAEAVTVLKLSGRRPMVEAERSRMLWARVKTMELLSTTEMELDDLARQVLHMDPPFDVDESNLNKLRAALTHAFAVGRDAFDTDVAATFNLEVHGAFDDTATGMDTVLDGAKGSARDFTGEPRPQSRVNLAQVITSGGLVDAPWRNRNPNQQAAAKVPHLVRAELDPQDPDTILMAIGGRDFRGPISEFLEMVARDPTLIAKERGTEVVFSHAGLGTAADEVAWMLAQRLGCPVWWIDAPTNLSGKDGQGNPVLTVAVLAGQ
ncbi:lonely Cys domain-containing protein, partial [Streptomyces milbemycinicus]|uniref:lonely Cys domain-containing protein n=1 Tax=Streptomyces milbemycinicus TaxID=476552 RepID=UPI0011815B0B